MQAEKGLELSKEVLDRLDVLGTKIGATGEHLWNVLVHAQFPDAAAGVISVIVGWVLWIWLHRRFLRWNKTGHDEEEGAAVCMVMIWIMFVILAIMSMCGMYVIVRALWVPEYGALQEVLKAVTK